MAMSEEVEEAEAAAVVAQRVKEARRSTAIVSRSVQSEWTVEG